MVFWPLIGPISFCRRYYKTQDELINAFEELQLDVEDAMDNSEEMARLNRLSRRLAQASFAVNLVSKIHI